MEKHQLFQLPTALLAMCLSWVVACVPETETFASRSDAIYGGNDVASTNEPEVFMLVMIYPDGKQIGCSATLIGSKTLLTAAHCVDPRQLNAPSVQIWAFNKSRMSDVAQGESIEVTQTRLHPQWQPSSLNPRLEHDIALGLLSREPRVTPKAWNLFDIQGFEGKPLRAMGYGRANADDASAGVKRQVVLSFRDIKPQTFRIGDNAVKGTCIGDSGGPSFHTFPDGIERVVGVHSFITNNSCVNGGDTRVDAYASFISAGLDQFEKVDCEECSEPPKPRPEEPTCTSERPCDGGIQTVIPTAPLEPGNGNIETTTEVQLEEKVPASRPSGCSSTSNVQVWLLGGLLSMFMRRVKRITSSW